MFCNCFVFMKQFSLFHFFHNFFLPLSFCWGFFILVPLLYFTVHTKNIQSPHNEVVEFGQYDLRTVKAHCSFVYQKVKTTQSWNSIYNPSLLCFCHLCFHGNLFFFCLYLMSPFKNMVALIFLISSSLVKFVSWCCQTFLLSIFSFLF